MTAEQLKAHQLEIMPIFKNAVRTVRDYQNGTATYEDTRAVVQAYADADDITYERAAQLIMELIR